MEDPLSEGKQEVIKEVIKAAAENKQIQEAGSNIAKAALTVSKTINTVLLPFAAINYTVDKAKQYFEENFGKELAEKTVDIPLEQIVEPKASIAGPAIQGLAYSHEEPELKDLYLKLLATSMDGRIARHAHPAFVEIIKQLNSEEAQLLKTFLQIDSTPAAEIRERSPNGIGWVLRSRHVVNIKEDGTEKTIDKVMIPAMIDNFTRLGLVTASYDQWIEQENSYDWVAQSTEYTNCEKYLMRENGKIEFQRGVITRTSFGIQFGRVVGII